jgi:hypothetical protein
MLFCCHLVSIVTQMIALWHYHGKHDKIQFRKVAIPGERVNYMCQVIRNWQNTRKRKQPNVMGAHVTEQLWSSIPFDTVLQLQILNAQVADTKEKLRLSTAAPGHVFKLRA